MSSASHLSISQHTHPVFSKDEIDLRQLARAVWRYRWIVVVLASLGGLAGLGASLLSTKFVAEGLFLTPALSIASFKQYEAALGNEQRVRRFIDLSGLNGTQTEELLDQLVFVPGAMGNAVAPAFALTGREAKAYDIKVEDSGVLGIRLTVERAAVTSESPIQRLADYVRHTMIDVDLREVLLTQCLAFQSKARELRNDQIQSDFTVLQARQKADRLRALISSVPGAAAVDSRQVVSLEGGGERFLSPTAQLVAVEVEISEAELADARRDRERIAASLKSSYYCQAKDLHQQALLGPELLIRLSEVQSTVFEGHDLSIDIVEQTANELALQRQGWLDHYMERARFVVSPEGGEQQRRKPGRFSGTAIGVVLGGLLGLLAALMLAWWHDNREAVVSVENE